MKKPRAPWPRWAKIMWNLLLFFLFAHTVWVQLDKPLPYNAALHRTARQYLFPKMEHSAEISRGYWGGAIRIDWTEGAAMLSIPARRSGAGHFYTPIVEPYRLGEGTNLLASPWSTILPGEDPGTIALHAVYIAVNPPKEGERAVLTLHNNAGTFTAEAEKENDLYVFYIRPKLDENGIGHLDSLWYQAYAYELEFYDATGAMTGRISG